MYETRFHLQPLQITIVFAVYVVGIVAALVTLGSLSDYVGRRPLILTSAILMIGADVIFLNAQGFTFLLLARILQGLGIGVGNAALAAALGDFVPGREGRIASILAGALPPTSLCLGALGGGVAAEILTNPVPTAYGACLGAGVLAAAIVFLLPEAHTRRPGAWSSIRPKLAIPASTRPAFRAVAGALIAGWALIGLYLALMPSVLAEAWPHTGAVGRVLPISGALAAAAIAGLALGRASQRHAMQVALTALVIGSIVVGVALSFPGVPWAVLAPGTAIAGFGYGGTFQSSLRHVVAATDPDHRAAVLAAALSISFAAFGLPSVIAGALVPLAGVVPVAATYACSMMAISIVTQIGYARFIRREMLPGQDELNSLRA